MTPINKVIINKETGINPIWIMRQAGRYLPEFREIRAKNKDFIKLCLDENLSSEITLQPLKRFNLDAAIIFSDILMLPYGLNQKVEFKKNFGPILGDLDISKLTNYDEIDFVNKILPVYKAINKVSNNTIIKNKNTIGFVGAPWTLLVYIINKQSPKKGLKKNFFKDQFFINRVLGLLEKFLKIHIKNQIENGANVIQIFDSWAGLLEEKDLPDYVYIPTLNLVNYVKSLNIPVICFPRGIKNYKNYCDIIKPDVIGIDYEIDPLIIIKQIKIPVQGGLDPKILLTDNKNIKKNTLKYLEIFKDHPYIFNLGHGVLPETRPEAVEDLVNTVKDF
jgi:uroporphyrinogen decarboxylase